jgi:myo-inositol-1(or 4)-monophosphatase
MMPPLNEILDVAMTAAVESGKILLLNLGNIERMETKTDFCDLVTNVDIASEEKILSIIHQNFQAHVVLSEEAGLSSAHVSPHLWIADPLDGTTNYIHKYPFFATTLAYSYAGEIQVAVTYNPFFQELFHAVKGQGAYLNGKKITVSSAFTLETSLLATGFAYDRARVFDTNYKEFCHLTQITHGVRRGGSAALDLAYVAAGRLDGFWEHGLKPWDLAAGALLIQEAGGKISSYDQTPFDLYSGIILATNGKIHPMLSQEILNIKGTNDDT